MFQALDFSINRRNDFESVHLLNISNFDSAKRRNSNYASVPVRPPKVVPDSFVINVKASECIAPPGRRNPEAGKPGNPSAMQFKALQEAAGS